MGTGSGSKRNVSVLQLRLAGRVSSGSGSKQSVRACCFPTRPSGGGWWLQESCCASRVRTWCRERAAQQTRARTALMTSLSGTSVCASSASNSAAWLAMIPPPSAAACFSTFLLRRIARSEEPLKKIGAEEEGAMPFFIACRLELFSSHRFSSRWHQCARCGPACRHRCCRCSCCCWRAPP